MTEPMEGPIKKPVKAFVKDAVDRPSVDESSVNESSVNESSVDESSVDESSEETAQRQDLVASGFRRQPQQQRSQARVEQLLKAAAEVFWEVGYEAATTHAIARRANTAIGTLYRFFPNKLAIFHELEKRHRKGVEATHTQMMTPEFMQQSLADMIRQMVTTYADYFQDVGHRVVYIQYYSAPEMFVHFDDAVDTGFIKRFAGMLRLHNASLSTAKSELLAEVCHRSFNALLLSALRSHATHRAQLYQELQALLTNYLQPHMPARSPERLQPNARSYSPHAPEGNAAAQAVTGQAVTGQAVTGQAVTGQVRRLADEHRLSPRQQVAMTHVLTQGSLTIQQFETLCPERSRRTLQRDLKQLLSKGLLHSEGDTNQLIYRLVSP
ncbi:MAG: TetR/AcrR family transcriptional regulator [Cyanobacteria bacterium J06597_16]